MRLSSDFERKTYFQERIMPKTLFATNIPLENILVPLLAAFWILLIAGAVRIRHYYTSISSNSFTNSLSHSLYQLKNSLSHTSHKTTRTSDLRETETFRRRKERGEKGYLKRHHLVIYSLFKQQIIRIKLHANLLLSTLNPSRTTTKAILIIGLIQSRA